MFSQTNWRLNCQEDETHEWFCNSNKEYCRTQLHITVIFHYIYNGMELCLWIFHSLFQRNIYHLHAKSFKNLVAFHSHFSLQFSFHYVFKEDVLSSFGYISSLLFTILPFFFIKVRTIQLTMNNDSQVQLLYSYQLSSLFGQFLMIIMSSCISI